MGLCRNENFNRQIFGICYIINQPGIGATINNMNEIIQNIIIEVEKFNDSIKEALDSKKITNTGEAARSLRIDYGEDFVKSIGIFYLEFLDTGRGPGKFPPIQPLIDWAKKKFGVNDKEAKQIAFLTARKISQLGTEIYINNGKGIELDKKIIILRENLNQSIKNSVKFEVKEKLNEFKRAFIKQKYQI